MQTLHEAGGLYTFRGLFMANPSISDLDADPSRIEPAIVAGMSDT